MTGDSHRLRHPLRTAEGDGQEQEQKREGQDTRQIAKLDERRGDKDPKRYTPRTRNPIRESDGGWVTARMEVASAKRQVNEIPAAESTRGPAL